MYENLMKLTKIWQNLKLTTFFFKYRMQPELYVFMADNSQRLRCRNVRVLIILQYLFSYHTQEQ